jgi:hypothetical protein
MPSFSFPISPNQVFAAKTLVFLDTIVKPSRLQVKSAAPDDELQELNAKYSP